MWSKVRMLGCSVLGPQHETEQREVAFVCSMLGNIEWNSEERLKIPIYQKILYEYELNKEKVIPSFV
jgi:hypothetical protein